MTRQERIDRQDALYKLLISLPGADFGAAPECAESDPDAFFPEVGYMIAPAVKEMCERCPVRAECLEYALRNREHGVWGGTSEQERKAMLRRRRLAAVADPETGEAAA